MAHKTGGATLGGFAYEYDALGRITSRSHSLGAPSHPSPMSQSSQKTYAYDAAGRLVKEGLKTYRYGYLDKVLSVTDGKDKYTYTYHVDGQLARAMYVTGGSQSLATETEDFLWDGLALIQRGGERFINEPHVGNALKKLCFEGKPRAQRSARRARKGPRGNPVVSSKGTSYFNDMLGTTLGSKAKGKKYSAAALTAFGEDLTVNSSEAASRSPFPVPHSPFFTGKPYVAGLGHAFLFRNYRASLGKWQTADPLGYPDGWNQLGYLGNSANFVVDLYGACRIPRQGYEEDWVNFDGYRFGLKAYWTCNHNFDAPNIVGHWSENIEDGSQNVIDDYSYRGYHAVLVFFTNEITNTFTLASHSDFLNHVYNLLIEVEVYAYVYYVDENGIEHSESMSDRPEILKLTNHHTITRYQE